VWCRNCGAVKQEKLPWVAAPLFDTTRFAWFVGRRCRTATLQAVARELNKGESSHDLSRFLCFGKEGMLRGHGLEDQLHTFSCLAVLHNAVVAWNTSHLAQLVERLRAEGHGVDERDLAQLFPLMRKHLNPFGRYHFNLDRLKRVQTTQ